MPLRHRSTRVSRRRPRGRLRWWLPLLLAALGGAAYFGWSYPATRRPLAAGARILADRLPGRAAARAEPVTPADPLQTTIGSFTFGSAAVLEKCWTPAELAGTAADRNVLNHDPHPDLSPPERTAPKHRRPPVPPAWCNSLREVEPRDRRRVIALTFDLCERPRERTGYDAALVNYLRANRIPATFFAGGKWLRSHPEPAMQLMADPLFEIGSHGWSHANHRVIPAEEGVRQVEWAQAEYELLWERLAARPCARAAGDAAMARIPPIPLLYRFPYGACDAAALDLLAEQGLPAVQWSIVTADPSPHRSAALIAATVLQRARPGAIVIGHANGRGHRTAEALALFVPKLREQGYEFVTVSDLLTFGRAVAATECYEERPGDNKKYDQLFREGR